MRNMRRAALILVLAATAAAMTAIPAQAGVYSDDLAKCLVKSTSDADKTALVTWVFAAIALHPAVKNYTKIDAAQRDAIETGAAQLFQRLVTVDCRAETVAALKYEGEPALEAGFSTLGEVATRGLMSDPQVSDALAAGFGKHLDAAKLAEVFREAGVKDPNAPAAKP